MNKFTKAHRLAKELPKKKNKPLAVKRWCAALREALA